PDAINRGIADLRELLHDARRLDRMTEILKKKRDREGVSVRCGSNVEIRARWKPIHVQPRSCVSRGYRNPRSTCATLHPVKAYPPSPWSAPAAGMGPASSVAPAQTKKMACARTSAPKRWTSSGAPEKTKTAQSKPQAAPKNASARGSECPRHPAIDQRTSATDIPTAKVWGAAGVATVAAGTLRMVAESRYFADVVGASRRRMRRALPAPAPPRIGARHGHAFLRRNAAWRGVQPRRGVLAAALCGRRTRQAPSSICVGFRYSSYGRTAPASLESSS